MSYCASLSVSDALVRFGLFVLAGDRVCRIQNMLLNVKKVQPKIKSYLYIFLFVCLQVVSWSGAEELGK